MLGLWCRAGSMPSREHKQLADEPRSSGALTRQRIDALVGELEGLAAIEGDGEFDGSGEISSDLIRRLLTVGAKKGGGTTAANGLLIMSSDDDASSSELMSS